MNFVRLFSSGPLVGVVNLSVIAAGAWSLGGLLDKTTATYPAAKTPAKKVLAEKIAFSPSERQAAVPGDHSHPPKVSEVASTSDSWNTEKSDKGRDTPRSKRVTSAPVAVANRVAEMEDAFFMQGLSGVGHSARREVVIQSKSNGIDGPLVAMGGGYGYGFGDAKNSPIFVDTDGDGYGDRTDSDPLDSYLWQDWDRDGKNDPIIELPDLPDLDNSGSIGSGSVRNTVISSGSSSETITLPSDFFDLSGPSEGSDTEAIPEMDE